MGIIPFILLYLIKPLWKVDFYAKTLLNVSLDLQIMHCNIWFHQIH